MSVCTPFRLRVFRLFAVFKRVGSLIFTSILPMFAPVKSPFMASTHDSMPS